MRLIDADALKKKAKMKGHCLSALITLHYMCVSTHDIDDAPTIEAEPVKHGRWEKQQGLYSCSECGKVCPYDVQADVIEYWPCNYCPNCGARMDLEESND